MSSKNFSPDSHREGTEQLLQSLQDKIYRKAAGSYLKDKQSGEKQSVATEADISELQAFIDEYLHYTNTTTQTLQPLLAKWAEEYPEENVKGYLIKLIGGLFVSRGN